MWILLNCFGWLECSGCLARRFMLISLFWEAWLTPCKRICRTFITVIPFICFSWSCLCFTFMPVNIDLAIFESIELKFFCLDLFRAYLKEVQ